MHIFQKHSCPVLSCPQYIRTCMQAKEPPHLTLVHTSSIKQMYDKEISTISAVVSRKSSNPPLPLPPKRRVPTVSPVIPVCVSDCTVPPVLHCDGFVY